MKQYCFQFSCDTKVTSKFVLVRFSAQFLRTERFRGSLMDVIRGNVHGSIRWTLQMERAFKNIKKALCNDVLVLTPDFSKIFILQSDASETAIGAVLCQDQEGMEWPIAFASKKLNETETRYSTINHCLILESLVSPKMPSHRSGVSQAPYTSMKGMWHH